MMLPIKNEKLKYELKHQLEILYPTEDVKIKDVNLMHRDIAINPDCKYVYDFDLAFTAEFSEKPKKAININNLELNQITFNKLYLDQRNNHYADISTQIADVLEDYYGE